MRERIEGALLEKNGGNQSELARFVGVSPQAVQKWIAGDSEPKGKNLTKVAAFLGLSEALLRYGEMHGQPSPSLKVVSTQDSLDLDDQVSADQIIELLSLFQQSSDRGRENILSAARAAAKRGHKRWSRTRDDKREM